MEAVGMVKRFRVDARLDQCSPVVLRTTNSSGPRPKFRDKNIPEEPGHLYVESAYQEFDLGSLFHVGLMF
jgi:hypothetical protein